LSTNLTLNKKTSITSNKSEALKKVSYITILILMLDLFPDIKSQLLYFTVCVSCAQINTITFFFVFCHK
jgi:hypothetical protein